MEEIRLFVENVREMRRMQNLYFKTRDYMVLRKAKSLEKIVDDMCDKYIEDGKNDPRQLDLGL